MDIYWTVLLPAKMAPNEKCVNLIGRYPKVRPFSDRMKHKNVFLSSVSGRVIVVLHHYVRPEFENFIVRPILPPYKRVTMGLSGSEIIEKDFR